MTRSLTSLSSRIGSHDSSPPASLLYVSLVSAVLAAFALDGPELQLREVTLPGVAVVTSALFAIAVSTTLVARAVRFASARTLGKDLSLSIGAGAVTVVVAVAKIHYAVFKEHLGFETLRIAVDALTSGEVEIGAGTLLSIATLFFGCLAASLAALRVLARVRFLAGFATAVEARPLLLLGAAVGFGVVEATIPVDDSFARGLREKLPWHRTIDPASDLFADFSISDASGAPLSFDARPEGGDLALLRRVESEVLAGGVRVQRTPNILLIVMESFRADLVSRDGTPHLAQLADECLSAERSFTIGPDTQTGIFGLLNGLSMFQYWDLQGSGFQPLPLAILAKLGYERSFYYSYFDLQYADMGARFFRERFDRHSFSEAASAAEADEAMIEELIADLRTRDPERPHFDFVFFYSTHWSYSFPEAFEKFRPVAPENLKLMHATATSPLFEHAEGLKNRQRNAALYVDHLVGRLLAALREAETTRDTVVVVTSDHGEEFFERGRFGHLWGLNDEMTRVPLFFCLTGDRRTRYRFATHSDVFPTLFDYMGLDLDGRSFMTGKSLLRYFPGRDHAVLGIPRRRALKRMAIVGDGFKIEFRPFGQIRPVAIFDLNDDPQTEFDPDAMNAVRSLMARLPSESLMHEEPRNP